MMYDDLIKTLRSAADSKRKFDNEVFLEDIAADAIEELSLSKDMAFVEEDGRTVIKFIPKWVPVTERLPEENGEYLVVYTLKAIPPIQRVEICSFAKNLRNVNKYDLPKNKPGFFQSDSEYGYYEITGITHWMALPEPPKGDE